MADEMLRIVVAGEERLVKRKTLLKTLAEEYQAQYPQKIVLASINYRLRELSKGITDEGELHFVTTDEPAGRKAYRRSLTLLMEKAVHKVVGSYQSTAVVLFSIGHGYYCEMTEGYPVTEAFVKAVEEEMRSLVAQDLPITKDSWNTEEATAYFAGCGMKDKEALFRYRRSSRINVYNLDGYRDYYYGYMVPSTGYLDLFAIEPYHNGFVLMHPGKGEHEVRSFVPSDKLFSTLREFENWGEICGITTIGDLNDAIVEGRIQDVILTQEALMEKKIGTLAETIAANREKKFVMIAGPSSSGKTTFSYRLSIQLRAQGLRPHPFPLDDYYVDRENCPKDADGNYDFECLEALDVEQLNKDLTALLAGEEVETPIFNFKTGKREPIGKRMKLEKDDVLVIEGIHGLNDKLSYSIAPEHMFKVYISALAALNIDEHNYLPTTDARLLRRIVRDARTRGSSARDTIAMWPSVRRGEENYIFPFQEKADVIFNSGHIYELAVMKTYAEPLLFAVEKNSPEYQEAKRLLKFLDYCLPIPSEEIGSNSLIREFIGGGCFGL